MQQCSGRISIRRPGLAFAALVAGVTIGAFPHVAALAAPRVIVANASNNQLSLVNFEGEPSVTALNYDANERKSLRAIVVRNDFAEGVNLIVADTLAAEICLYADGVAFPSTAGRCQLIGSPTLAPGPQRPNSLALNPEGVLFAGSSGTGNAASKMAEIWAYCRDANCDKPAYLPGGYGDPVKVVGPLAIDITPGATPTLVPLEILRELRVYNGESSGRTEQGALIVLTSQPAAMVMLRGLGSSPFDAPPPSVDPYQIPGADVLVYPATANVDPLRRFPPGEPGGFAFAPDGRILITMNTGVILAYDLSGQRQPDFVTGLDQNGERKIEVIRDGGLYRAFVADRNRGEVLRLDIGPAGTGTVTGTIAKGVESPVAVAATNANVVRVSASQNGQPVAVDPTQGVLKTFIKLQSDGVAGGETYVVVDPRGPSDLSPLNLQQVDASLPNITIPPHIRGLPYGGADSAVEAFVVTVQAFAGDYLSAPEVVLDPSSVLGWTPSCRLLPVIPGVDQYGDSTDELDIVAWGTVAELDEPPILEGRTVIDVTASCNSPSRGIVREASIFVAARNLKSPLNRTSEALANLGVLLFGPKAAAIDRRSLRDLTQYYDAAVRAFDRARYVDTRSNLLAFADLASTVTGVPGRIGPELKSRSQAASFAVSFLIH